MIAATYSDLGQGAPGTGIASTAGKLDYIQIDASGIIGGSVRWPTRHSNSRRNGRPVGAVLPAGCSRLLGGAGVLRRCDGYADDVGGVAMLVLECAGEQEGSECGAIFGAL
jgi:hypothetical protein